MNKERILKVAEEIERYGDEHFDMSSYCNRGARGRPTACGTTACIAGWAMYIGRQEIGPRNISRSDDPADPVREWLGLDVEQAKRLFYPEDYWRNRDRDGVRYSAARAVAVLRHLAETGVVGWWRFSEAGADEAKEGA